MTELAIKEVRETVRYCHQDWNQRHTYYDLLTAAVGEAVGFAVGELVGLAVGFAVGDLVGLAVG